VKFYLQNKVWDKNQILSQKKFTPDYFGQTLQFCQDWLEEKQEFELQTSGSTGMPKPILVQRSQMKASAKATAKKLNLQAEDTALICLNTNYIAGKMMLVRSLEAGMNAVIFEPQANPFTNFSTNSSDNFFPEELTFTALVPMQLQSILEDKSATEKLEKMKAILVGGAPVSQELEMKIQSLSVPIYATYGMTETVSHIALKCLNGSQKQSFYETLPAVKIGQDERECLTISAPMTLGKTLITNDRVHLISKEKFEWLGRIDNVINSGGVKIQAEKIEEIALKILTKMGLKMQCITIGIPDKKLGQKVVLVLESEDLSSTIQEEIYHQFQEKLSRYECPKSIQFLSKFPETPTGKIQRLEIIQNLKISEMA